MGAEKGVYLPVANTSVKFEDEEEIRNPTHHRYQIQMKLTDFSALIFIRHTETSDLCFPGGSE